MHIAQRLRCWEVWLGNPLPWTDPLRSAAQTSQTVAPGCWEWFVCTCLPQWVKKWLFKIKVGLGNDVYEGITC